MSDTQSDWIVEKMKEFRELSMKVRMAGEKEHAKLWDEYVRACVLIAVPLHDEVISLRAGRDAAVAEAVARERENSIRMVQNWFGTYATNAAPLIAALRRGEP